jgi:hypothetical protein
VAELSVNLGYTKVLAPISGLTSRSQKSEGSLVTANETLLTTISQTHPIWVVFNISENEQLRLNRAVTANQLMLPKDNAYEVTVKLSDGSTLPRKGRINFSDTRINPTTGTYEMRAEIANPDGALKPGQFVRVILRGAERQNVVAVPQVAVLDGPQGKFVYTLGKDKDGKDVATPRPIVVGDWVDAGASNQWVIESGLKPGDQVLINGIAKVMPGGQVKVGTGAPEGAAGAPQAAGGGASTPSKAIDAGTKAPAAQPEAKAAEPGRARESDGIRAAEQVVTTGDSSDAIALLHRPPDLRGGDIAVPRARRPGRDALAADRAVPGDRAAGRHRAGRLSGRIGANHRANRRVADRERDQRRARHDLHELVVGVERRPADPGDIRHRYQRRHRDGQRQQPRQRSPSAAAGGSSPPGRVGGARQLGVPAGSGVLFAR